MTLLKSASFLAVSLMVTFCFSVQSKAAFLCSDFKMMSADSLEFQQNMKAIESRFASLKLWGAENTFENTIRLTHHLSLALGMKPQQALIEINMHSLIFASFQTSKNGLETLEPVKSYLRDWYSENKNNYNEAEALKLRYTIKNFSGDLPNNNISSLYLKKMIQRKREDVSFSTDSLSKDLNLEVSHIAQKAKEASFSVANASKKLNAIAILSLLLTQRQRMSLAEHLEVWMLAGKVGQALHRQGNFLAETLSQDNAAFTKDLFEYIIGKEQLTHRYMGGLL